MADRLNLIETIAKEDKFSTFSRLLGTSGANTVFSAPGEFTVFVPTNDAFGKIPDKKMDALLNEPGQVHIKAMLSYHVMGGRVLAARLGSMMTRKTVTGEEIAFSGTNGLKVNGAGIQACNIEATNGVIHQIDTVLTAPPRAAGAKAAAADAPIPAPSLTTIRPANKASEADTLPGVARAEIAVGPDDAAAIEASSTSAKPIF